MKSAKNTSMKVKTTHKEFSARHKMATAISLLLVAVLTGAALTYAWFQNFLDVSGTRVQTGKMLYEFSGYHVSADSVSRDFFYSTQNGNNGANEEEELDILAGENGSSDQNEGVTVNPGSINPVSALSHLTVVDTQTVGQSFFVVNKLDGSIDFDVGLAFSFDTLAVEQTDENGETVYVDAAEYANSMWFKVYNESPAWSDYIHRSATPTVEEYVSQYQASGDMLESTGSQPLSKLAVSDRDDYSGFLSLSGDDDQVFIRVVYGWNSDLFASSQAVDVPVKVHLSVAQVGALTGGSEITESVFTYEQLRAALTSYKAGASITIAGHVTYPGDLTISRPVTLIISGSLTVQGNMSFMYTNAETSEIRTRGGGQLFVEGRNGLGGNFIMDLPNGSLMLVGSNSDEMGKADIYVAGEFRVRSDIPALIPNASEPRKPTMDAQDDESGLALQMTRICHLNESGKNSTELQSIKMMGATRIFVDKRTYVGEISADYTCEQLQLLNFGYVQRLNLENMLQDRTIKTTPAICIDSRGYWTDEQIRLPRWSTPYVDGGNTLIYSNPGSGPVKAKTPAYYDDNFTAPNSLFYDDYTTEFPGDIQYEYRQQFVEKVTETVNGEDILVYLVHYDTIHESKRSALGLAEDDPFGTTLESIVSYYYSDRLMDPSEEIPPLAAIPALEIICYGDKVLTEADYAYIRQMKVLKYLNIQESVSENGTLPRGALQGLSELTDVVMSDSDHTWMPDAFKNTDIQMIKLPASLQTLKNDTDSTVYKNNTYTCSMNNVIGDIRVVCTSTTVVDGFAGGKVIKNGKKENVDSASYEYTNWYDRYFYDDDKEDKIYQVKQYIFTPDELTRDAYRKEFVDKSGNANQAWNRCVFALGEGGKLYPEYTVNTKNEKEFIGFYVLRLNDEGTCDFITYTGKNAFDIQKARDSSFKFDFSTIQVEGVSYNIRSYDEYAFAQRFQTPVDLVFGDTVQTLKSYSFASLMSPYNAKIYTNRQKLSTVTFKGETEIGSYAFYWVDQLTEVSGALVDSISERCFMNCASLTTVSFPSLSEVAGAEVFYQCTALEWLHMSVIERNETNTSNFTSKLEGLNVEIHTDTASSPASYTAALGVVAGRIFVPSAYAELYMSNYPSSVAEMGDKSVDTLLRADRDGNILAADDPTAPAYYFYTRKTDGRTTAVLVACLFDINEGGGDHTTVGAFKDLTTGESIPVTRIGGAAYRMSSITGVETLTIADSVTEIGPGAFYSSGYPKYCITFDLNNTVLAETYAFYAMGPIRLVGNELETIGLYTLTELQKMIVACLPKLDHMVGGENKLEKMDMSAFHNCKSLHVAYVGPSRTVRYLQTSDNHNNTGPDKTDKHLRMFFVNGDGVTESVTMTSFNNMVYVVANCDPELYPKPTVNGSRINGGTNFENIVFSNWYTIEGENGGVSYSVTLPGYLYSITGEGTLSLQSTVAKLEDAYEGDAYEELYVTPDALYVAEINGTVQGYNVKMEPLTMVRYVAEPLAGDPVYRVTKIESGAYNYTTIKSKCLKIGASTTELAAYAFYSSMTVTMVEKLDLGNVEITGNSSLYAFSDKVTAVIADRLKTVGASTFAQLKSVEKLYLPAVEVIKHYAFSTMNSLNELILGPNFTSFNYNPMKDVAGDPQLKIIIMNDSIVVESPQKIDANTTRAFGSGKTGDNNGVYVVVPQKQYAAYKSAYETSGWTNTTRSPASPVPFSNFSVFEAYFEDPSQNLTFFWSKVDETAHTAKITFVVGNELPDTLVFPDTITEQTTNEAGETVTVEWTVVAVETSAIELMAGVKQVVLPAGMQYLGFASTDVPESVDSFVIAEGNAKFRTIDGVLYSADGLFLFMAPRGFAPTQSEFHLPESVVYIADEAFYGVTGIRTVYVTNPVRIGARAFAETRNLTVFHFVSSTPSQFIGRDIFLNADASLVLYVPEGSVEDYRNSLFWLNFDYRDKIRPKVEVISDESGGEDPSDDGA